MKYRVQLDISFDEENNAISFLNLIERMKGKVFIGTGAEPITIVYSCRYHKCFHDDVVPQPCGNYVNVDLEDGVIIEHKNTAEEIVKANVIIPDDVKTDIINSQ